MLHHYLQIGILPEKILKASETEKLFYYASMEIKLEGGE